MPNAWLQHVKEVRKKHPNKKYKDVLKLASSSYGGRRTPQSKGLGASIAKKTYKKQQKGAGFINSILNALPSSDKNARPGYPGEKHTMLKLPNGLPGRANFVGPGTQIVKRLRRGDPPRTLTDKVAQMHDIRLTLSRTPEDVRYGDNKMISKLKELSRKKLDSQFNIQQGMKAIQLKTSLEDAGVLPKGSFGNMGDKVDKIPRADLVLLRRKEKQLEQQGFGRRRLLRF